MSKKMFRSEDFKSPEGTISFAHGLFTPNKRQRDDGSTRESYECTLIFDEKHRPFFEAKLKEAIVSQWSERGIERAKSGLIKSPLLSGTGKEARNKESGELHPGMGEGKFFIRVSSNFEPVVRWKSPNIPASKDEVYSGSSGFAVLNTYCWNHSTNGDGVSFGIQYYQKTGEGDRLGGGGAVDPGKWYEKVETDDEAPAETQDGAGADGLFG